MTAKGERVINGKHYLLNGRYNDRATAVKAATQRKEDGFMVKIIKIGFMDYRVYEFPLD